MNYPLYFLVVCIQVLASLILIAESDRYKLLSPVNEKFSGKTTGKLVIGLLSAILALFNIFVVSDDAISFFGDFLAVFNGGALAFALIYDYAKGDSVSQVELSNEDGESTVPSGNTFSDYFNRYKVVVGFVAFGFAIIHFLFARYIFF